MLLTDEQLMQEVGQGSLPAFELLFQRWNRRMYFYFLRCTGDAHEAEDLCQDVFYTLFRQRKTFRADGSFKPWLFRVATNLMIDKVWRKKKVDLQTLDADESGDWAVSVEPVSRAVASAQETSERVERALACLPEDMRVLLVMRHYEELTFKDMTDALGIPESTVKTRVYRALTVLRRSLKEAGVLEADCLPAAR